MEELTDLDLFEKKVIDLISTSFNRGGRGDYEEGYRQACRDALAEISDLRLHRAGGKVWDVR